MKTLTVLFAIVILSGLVGCETAGGVGALPFYVAAGTGVAQQVLNEGVHDLDNEPLLERLEIMIAVDPAVAHLHSLSSQYLLALQTEAVTRGLIPSDTAGLLGEDETIALAMLMGLDGYTCNDTAATVCGAEWPCPPWEDCAECNANCYSACIAWAFQCNKPWFVLEACLDCCDDENEDCGATPG